MIAVFALEVKWTRSHTPNDKKVEEALKLGHVIEAKRVHFWDDGVTPDERSTSWYHATYTYNVSGDQYQYKYLERVYPPMVIKLYYLNNPRKAFRSAKRRSGISQILFLMLPIVVGVGVAYLLGGV